MDNQCVVPLCSKFNLYSSIIQRYLKVGHCHCLVHEKRIESEGSLKDQRNTSMCTGKLVDVDRMLYNNHITINPRDVHQRCSDAESIFSFIPLK